MKRALKLLQLALAIILTVVALLMMIESLTGCITKSCTLN